MVIEFIILAVVVAVFLLSVPGFLVYWVKKKLDRLEQSADATNQANHSERMVFAQQTSRRRAAICMFFALLAGVGALVVALLLSTLYLPTDDFVRGIILTAIAGAISGFLSLIGLIVKGLVDNLTRDES